mgnify:CR=1 FL=1
MKSKRNKKKAPSRHRSLWINALSVRQDPLNALLGGRVIAKPYVFGRQGYVLTT